MEKSMKTELLAPAKDKETAIAAIDSGADAIYIGAYSFGARKNASNSLEDIKFIVEYAHKFWVKVFVTMNTILTDLEVAEAVNLAKELSNIGVDALIIQDMGLLEKLIEISNETFKLAPIHMSTQCDNYLPQKVHFFNNIGVSRVILARELSIEEISNIHQKNPNLELEAFVHGALCVSMSGQCYLSQSIGGRSANRGECAQPCRKKYSIENSNGKIIKKDFYALCLKDFNASEYLSELKEAGIYSFKIEGRLKDINYVKNIVTYYRKKLGKGSSSGVSHYAFEPNPEKTFNRGFTTYFLKNRTDCYNQESPKSRGQYIGKIVEIKKECLKVHTNEILKPQDGIYCNGDGFLINKIIDNYIYPNKKVNFKIGDKIYRNFDVEFEKKLQNPIKRQIEVNIKISDYIEIMDEDGISIRKDIPLGEIANNPEKIKENFIKQFSKTGDTDFYVNNIEIQSELPFFPISEINKLRRELLEDLMNERIEFYNGKIHQWQKPMTHCEYFLKEVDYRANVHNKLAEEFYKKCGTIVLEPSFESQRPTRQIALMRCKHCIKYSLNMCKSPENLVLRDEYGKTYPLKFDCKKCEMSVMSN